MRESHYINITDATPVPFQRKQAVHAVVVTYNGIKWIERCIESILKSSVDTLTIVDNASTDDTIRRVSEKFPTVNIIENHKNRGFGVANNQGIAAAVEQGAKYILLVNQDLFFNEKAVDLLVSILERESQFGIVSALQLTYDGRSIDPIFRSYIPSAFFDDLYFNGKSASDLYESSFVPAACVLVRTQLFTDIGGFDPVFFLYGEDDDLCKRAVLSGWRIGISPIATACHWHGMGNRQQTFAWHVNLYFSRTVLQFKHYRGHSISGLLRIIGRRIIGGGVMTRLAEVVGALKCLLVAPALISSRESSSLEDPVN